MADDGAWAAEAPLAPEEVSDRSFPTAFRGFDPVEVRAFLGRVADEVRRLHAEEAELRRLLEESAERPPDSEAEALLAAAQSEAAAVLAAAQAEAAAAVSTARSEADAMLREARERVATLGTAATAEAARMVEGARAEAARIRGSAADELRTRTEEAESAAVRRIAEAEREAAIIRVNARAEADAVIEAARERGREMVGEAQAARERMLADLSRRKRAAQAHLEQMKASRDRLLETLKVARRSIDEVSMRFEVQEGGGTERPAPSERGAGQERPAERGAVPSAGESPAGAPGPGATAPARSRGMAIGEAPLPPGRPHIAAPHAQAAQESPPPAPPQPTAGPEHPPSPPQREVRTEERRSSALRILRRNRQPEKPAPEAPPHTVGRDSPAEGVRIIRGDAAEASAEPPFPPPPPAPAVPPEQRPVPESRPEMRPEPEPAAAAPRPVASSDRHDDDAVEVVELAEAEGHDGPMFEPASEPLVVAAATAAPAAEVPLEVNLPKERAPGLDGTETEPLVPLAPEEIRPRIEDLFARLRAERQAAATATPTSADPLARADTTPSNGVGEPARPGPLDAGRAPSPVATADREEHLLQSRDRVIEPLAAQLTRRLKRALQDEQNTTLDRLRTSRGQAQLEGLLPAGAEQAEPYRRLALSFLAEAARAGTTASPYGPVPVDVADLAAELGGEVAGGLRARVRQLLAATAGEDLDLSTISDRISAVYRECKTQKVERLANHFLLAAHERGRFVAYPEGTRLRWIVDDDGPCPDCDDNALAGGVPRGQSFPTGQVHPPAHLGCRCLLTPAPT